MAKSDMAEWLKLLPLKKNALGLFLSREPFWVEFASSLCAHVGFLWVL